jgi:hypothetical protein
LTWTSSPFSMPMIHRFDLLMHSQILSILFIVLESGLRILLFFFYLYLLCVWALKFCLACCNPLEWLSTVYFTWFKGLFYFQDFCFIFFWLSISLLYTFLYHILSPLLPIHFL